MTFLFIESIAGSAFLQGSGIVVMILLGFMARDAVVIKEHYECSAKRIGEV